MTCFEGRAHSPGCSCCGCFDCWCGCSGSGWWILDAKAAAGSLLRPGVASLDTPRAPAVVLCRTQTFPSTLCLFTPPYRSNHSPVPPKTESCCCWLCHVLPLSASPPAACSTTTSPTIPLPLSNTEASCVLGRCDATKPGKQFVATRKHFEECGDEDFNPPVPLLVAY